MHTSTLSIETVLAYVTIFDASVIGLPLRGYPSQQKALRQKMQPTKFEPTKPSSWELRPTEVRPTDKGLTEAKPTKSRSTKAVMLYLTKPPLVVLVSQKSAEEPSLKLVLKTPLLSKAKPFTTKAAALPLKPMIE